MIFLVDVALWDLLRLPLLPFLLASLRREISSSEAESAIEATFGLEEITGTPQDDAKTGQDEQNLILTFFWI